VRNLGHPPQAIRRGLGGVSIRARHQLTRSA
jgi:hypothetical protein